MDALVLEARDIARAAQAAIVAHERECSALRKSQEQWQQSALRILDGIKAELIAHSEADGKIQKSIDQRLDGWTKWIIGVLASMLGGCFVIIGAFTWHALYG